jgi:uncharacterized delta-60 repeat protein
MQPGLQIPLEKRPSHGYSKPTFQVDMKSFKMLAVALGAVAITGSAFAIATLVISDGVTTTSLTSASGIINYTNASFDAPWGIFLTVKTKPAVGSNASPILLLNAKVTSLGFSPVRNLRVSFSDNDFGPAPSGFLVAELSGQVISGTGQNVNLNTYYDRSNTTSATTSLLTASGPLPPPTYLTKQFGSPGALSLYSLTEILTINGTSSGTPAGTYDFSSVLQVGVPDWTARYNGPDNSHDQANTIATDASGNIYVTGVSYNSNGSQTATLKYNANGQTQWTARYGPAGGYSGANALATDRLGNVYVTGYSAAPGGSTDFVTLKYAPNGVTQWVARYDGPARGYDSAKAITLDAAGNVYVTGDSLGATSFDFATIKYDNNGNQLWVARFDGAAHGDDSPAGLSIDAAGNAYVVGWSTPAGGGSDCVTVKYSPAGAQQWRAVYHAAGPPADSAATALALDAAGSVYVAGYSYAPATSYDYLILKYAPDGSQLWIRSYNGPGNCDDQAAALALDAGTNVLVTGYSYGLASNPDYATVKYDRDGHQLWVARYDGPPSLYDAATALAVDPAGEVFVTGISAVSTDASDYVTLKYNANGGQLWLNRYHGAGNSSAAAIALDQDGVAYVTGWSDGPGSSQDFLTARYGDPVPPPVPPDTATSPLLSIRRAGQIVVLSWPDTSFGLQSAPAQSGPYASVPAAGSPYTNTLGSTPRFFRLKRN